ncbi:NAD(P)H-dependent oxidoreductase [Achromobacter xylosoxidans]
MSILTLAGSPSQRSRSSALLRHAAHLRARGLAIAELGLRDLPAEDLIEGHYAGPAANALRARVAAVDAVLISTPVYKASFSEA